ncbi:SIR2-like protein [Kribbella antiqua]|uniref:SIR2-like protein n=1 Tax=Kribbella antiqua TaxID=2512217 RepID=A0A4R2IFX7_9ACTN|nr:SIR2 family protein [Kribbella antiqua]TCO43614.1 SIR2-like protein [Kribbella antiqua]
MIHQDRLVDDLINGRVVVFVGAGVSVATTANAPTASWLGLLKSGVAYAEEVVGAGLEDWWAEEARHGLERGMTYMPSLLSVAQMVETELSAPDGTHFFQWLQRDVGDLSVKNRDVVSAIVDLRAPIVTTNYDNLISDVSGRDPVTWLDNAPFRAALHGSSNDIAHLHGHWKKPRSVILGYGSYGRVMQHPATEALEHALGASKTILFVGFGEGLADPNFEALRNWLNDKLEGSAVTHYRLCRSSELATLQQYHSADSIQPIAYGSEYSDLAGYLRNIRSSGADSEVMVSGIEQAMESISDRVRSGSVLIDHTSDPGASQIDELLIAPVILPVSHEQFTASLDSDPEIQARRCDIAVEIKEPSILLAADEHSGLTSAMDWMLHKRAGLGFGELPVMVDCRDLGRSGSPLRLLVVQALRQIGVRVGKNQPLPKLALAIDNFPPAPSKLADKVLDELQALRLAWLIIGCRSGLEANIYSAMSDRGLDANLRYLGRFNTSDVRKLAELAASSPAQALTVARKAISIVTQESLSRTPFTFSVLISTLLHGESKLAAASDTALLDEYIGLLLGRGNVYEDARFGLDSYERFDILASLAEQFVLTNSGSLPESVVVTALEKYFEEVGWVEDPTEVFTHFRELRILAVSNSQVRFTQSSYLHLLSAKRALVSENFRQLLYSRPLYYAPIIRHYAALARGDAEVLKVVASLLWAHDKYASSASGMFGELPAPELDGDASSVESLMRQLDLDMPGKRASFAETTEPSDYDWLDHLEDEDREAFPLDQVEDGPELARVSTALSLVSNVLRDSEMIRDQHLKKTVFHRILVVWGVYVELLGEDDEYEEFVRGLARRIGINFGVAQSKADEFVDIFMGVAPILAGFTGMSITLSSRKLILTLKNCFKDPAFLTDPKPVVMGALYAFGLQTEGWIEYFSLAQREHPRVRAVDKFFPTIATSAYYRHTLTPAEADALHDFILEHKLHAAAPMDRHEEQRARQEFSQRLKRNRMLWQRKSPIPRGQTVYSVSPDDEDTPEELESGDA